MPAREAPGYLRSPVVPHQMKSAPLRAAAIGDVDRVGDQNVIGIVRKVRRVWPGACRITALVGGRRAIAGIRERPERLTPDMTGFRETMEQENEFRLRISRPVRRERQPGAC